MTCSCFALQVEFEVKSCGDGDTGVERQTESCQAFVTSEAGADSAVFAISFRVLTAGITGHGADLKSAEVNLFGIFRWLTERPYGFRALIILLLCS